MGINLIPARLHLVEYTVLGKRVHHVVRVPCQEDLHVHALRAALLLREQDEFIKQDRPYIKFYIYTYMYIHIYNYKWVTYS